MRVVVVVLMAASCHASFTVESALSTKSSQLAITDGITPLNDIGADERGLVDVFGSDPTIDPAHGMVSSGPFGTVSFYALLSDRRTFSTTEERVYTSPNRYAPSAICDGIVAVADRNLKLFEQQAGVWTQIASVGDESGPGQLFFPDRQSRRLRWHCNGGNSTIVANSGGPELLTPNLSYEPAIHVFRNTVGSPREYEYFTALNISNWALPREDGAVVAGDTLFDNPSYLYDDYTQRFVNTALERVAVSQTYAASLAAFYPEQFSSQQGFPLFAWKIKPNKEWELVATRGSKACAGTSVKRTAQISIDMFEVGTQVFWADVEPIIVVGCPAAQGGPAPVIEVFRRAPRIACDADIVVLEKIPDLFSPQGTGDFPGLSAIDLLPDNGAFTGGYIGQGVDPDSMAPAVRVLHGGVEDGLNDASARILVGDPGYDDDTVVDAGRAFVVELSLDPSQPDVLSLYNVFVEKTINAASAQTAQNFGALGAGGVQGSSVDLLAIGSPRRTPLPTISVTASTRADQQIITPAARTPHDLYFDGFSMDATDRWLVVVETEAIRMYSNADGVPGFAPTLQTSAQETPEEHSVVLTTPHPFEAGTYPTDISPGVFRGSPLVKFIPATVTHDGRPRLVIVHLASSAATSWTLTTMSPKLASDPTQDFAYDEELADDLQWVVDNSMQLPQGYNPCATLTNPCIGSGVENCFPYNNYTCAQRIVHLELPRGHSRVPVDEGLNKRQSGAWSPLDWEAAQAASGPGMGRGLDGCEDGVALGIPDAGDIPSVVVACIRNVRRSSSDGELLQLLTAVVPGNRSDARLVIGQSCVDLGVPGCVNASARASNQEARNMEAGTRILSGQLAGNLLVGANNDASRMELFRFDVPGGAFVPVLSKATSGPETPATLHPIESQTRRDVAAVEGADLIITPGASNTMLVHCVVAKATGLQITDCGHIPPPAAINTVNDKCKTAEFGTSVIVDKSMLVNEGILAIASTNLKSVASCTDRALASSQSEILSLYTVKMHAHHRARMRDTGFDHQSSPSTGYVRRSLASMGDAAGNGVTNHTRLLQYVAQHELPDTSSSVAEVHFLESMEFTTLGVSLSAVENLGAPGGYPGVLGERAFALRCGAWAIARTGQSPGVWHQAGQLGEPSNIGRATAVSMGGTVEPLDVLRAGSGHLRIFRQGAHGVVQFDRRIVAVASTPAAISTNGGTLFAPIPTISEAVARACADTPSFCGPVVVIGSKPGTGATYSPASLAQSYLPEQDMAMDASGVTDTKGTSAYMLRRTAQWADFNVSIRGAGMDRTRLVLELPSKAATRVVDTAFSAGGLHLQELTVDGGFSALQLTEAQTNGLAGGGAITIAGAGATRPRLVLERVRAINGGSKLSGGLIAATGAEVTIVDSILGNGRAMLRGGVMSLAGSDALVMRSLVSNSTSQTQDGGCFSLQSMATLVVDQSTIAKCTSGAAGGAIAVSESEAFISRSDIHQCRAFTTGGGVDVSFGKVLTWLSGFSSNEAESDGGAVHVAQSSPATALGTSLFADSSFVLNRAASGGAMRVAASGLVRTIRTGFGFNRASTNGAGLAVSSQASLWTDGGSVFRANVADADGGGAQSSALGRMYLSATRFVENFAINGGGVACTGGGAMSVDLDTDASFAATGFRLSATERARLEFNLTGSLAGVAFVDNTAKRTGGGLLSVSCDGFVTSPLFTSNHIGVAGATIEGVSILQSALVSDLSPYRRPWRLDSRQPFLNVASGSTVFESGSAAVATFPGVSIGMADQFDLPPSDIASAFSSTRKVGATTTLIPIGMRDALLPSLDVSLAAVAGTAQTNTRVAESLSDGGGAVYASYLEQLDTLRWLNLFDAQFVENTAAGGSGGCIFAAGVSDNTECVANPAKCFRAGTLNSAQAKNYFSLSHAVQFVRCRAFRGSAAFWSQIPFIGSTDIAKQNGLNPANLSLAHPAITNMTVTLTGNTRVAAPGTVKVSTPNGETDDEFATDDPYSAFYEQYGGDDAKGYSGGYYGGYGYEPGYYGSGGSSGGSTPGVDDQAIDDPYSNDNFLFFGDPVHIHDDIVGPPTDDIVGPPTDDIVGPPTDDIVGPPTDDIVGPPTDDTVEPPPTDDNAPPPTDDTVEPPPTDDNALPPTDDTVEPPPTDDNALPPTDDTVEPPPTDDNALPPTDDTVEPPPTDDNALPPTDDTVEPPPTDDNAPPPTDDTVEPPPTDDNALPPTDDTVEPPPTDDNAPPPTDDNAPPPTDDNAPPPTDDNAPPPPPTDDNALPPTGDDFALPVINGNAAPEAGDAEPVPGSSGQQRRLRRLQTVVLPPAIESMPSAVKFSPGFEVRSQVEPGGELSTIQGSLALERFDAYGTASSAGGFSATAVLTRLNYSASLIGDPTAVASTGSNRITFSSLQVKAAANVTPAVLTITPLLSGGIPPIVRSINMTSDCPGRQELQAPRYDQCTLCATAQVSDGLTCSNCPSGSIVGPSSTEHPRGHCTQCPAGKAENAGVCEDCTAGRFSSSAGQSSCQACDPGQFSAPGATSCTDCSPGRFSTTGVQEECTLCPAGTFSAATKTVACDSCTPGRFSNVEGSTQCEGCVGNSIAPTNRTVNCGECTAGQVSIQDKTICGACPAGTQATANEAGVLSCRTCPSGTITAKDGELCSSCADGEIPNVDRTACLTCHRFARCVAGSFVLEDAVWWTGNPVQLDVDAAGDPWVFIPESAELHRCPNNQACNMSLNALVTSTNELAAVLATDQNLTSSQRSSMLRASLQAGFSSSNSGVDCAAGHTGPRCALCEAGFSRTSGDGACVKCFDVEVNSLVVLAGILVLVGAASFLVNNTYKSNIKNKAGSNVTAGLIRIFMNYLKIQTTLGDFKARAPAVIMAIRQGAATVSSGVPVDVGPVACAFNLNFERQILGVVVMPMAIIAGTGIICFLLYLRAVFCPHRFGWVCCGCFSKKDTQVQPSIDGIEDGSLSASDDWEDASGRPISAAAKADIVVNRAAAKRASVPPADRGLVARKYRQFCQSAMVILLFLIYSMLVKQVFTAWSLYPDSIDGRNYLAVDFSVSTDSPAYGRITGYAAAGVGFWVFGIPAVAIYLLYKSRNDLLADDTQASLGFLYAGYNVGTASMVNTETAQQARRVVSELQKLATKDEQIIAPTEDVLSIEDGASAGDAPQERDELAAGVGAGSAGKARFRGGKADQDGKVSAAPDVLPSKVLRLGGTPMKTPVAASKQQPGDASSPARASEELELEEVADESVAAASADGRGSDFDDEESDDAADAADGDPTPSKSTRFAVDDTAEDPQAASRLPKLPMTKSFVTKKHHVESLKSRQENTEFLESIVAELETNAKHTATTFWYWEVVVLARLVAVTMVAVFVDDVFLQSYAALAIVIASLVAHLTAHPYSDLALNFAESMGLVTVLATQLGSLLWFFGDLELSALDDTAITIILIILNVAVLIVFAILLLLSMLGDARLRSIPYCGAQCSRAFFKERDLRRRFLAAQHRKAALREAHTKAQDGEDDPSSAGRGKRDAVRAVAIGGAAAVGAAGATAGWMSTFS